MILELLAGAAAVFPPLPADRQAAPSRENDVSPAGKGRVPLTVGLILNGSPLGDVTVETDISGAATIDVAQLLRLLKPILAKPALDALALQAGGREMVALAELSSPAFRIEFDLATLKVRAEIPVDARATRQLSIVDPLQFDAATVAPPEDVSAGITFNLANRFRQGRAFGPVRREPFTTLADGFVNYGGKDGLYLTFQAGFSEGGAPVRQRTTLFHDDVAHAVRFSIGDLDPQGFGSYYTPISVLGIGVERLYQEIQPYRNIRPAGRGSIAIERPSRVDILVNGALYRTLDLAPGRYDLRDFPFLDGLNDVQLVARDDSGRQQTTSLSFFSDTELLDPGISLFSAALGIRRDVFGDFVGTTYRHSPTVTGFYQRGISDRLTIGGSAQADKRNALVSGQAVVGTPIGLFGAEASIDYRRGDGIETAFLLSYRVRGRSNSGRSSSASVDIQYTSAGFSPMAPRGLFDNSISFDLRARYQRSLDLNTYASIGAGYAIGRGAQRNVKTATASISRRFDRLTASLNYDYRQDAPRSNHRFMLSLTLPLSAHRFARAGYDSDRNRATVDYSIQGTEGLNQTNARLSLQRSDLGRNAKGEIEYFGNRFRAGVQHEYDRTLGNTSETTDLRLSFGIGYAGGKLALGRDATRGFTIVAAHPTLNDAPVKAYDNYSLKPVAQTGAFGPALVPTRRSYALNAIQVRVENLPVGYDIGAGRIDILPGAASGYLFTVGSAASNTVIGTIIDAAGRPASFIAGMLEPISGREAKPVPFFTNRTGRMVAQKVAPGRYNVVPAGGGGSIGEVVVPERPNGPVQIGPLTIKEAK